MGEFVNSRQARFDRSHVSCGVVEMHHLPDASPADTAFALANHLYHKANGRPAAFALWSDVVDRKEQRGADIAEFLGKLGVGAIYESTKEINPKTGNTIRVWLMTLDHTAFRKWYADEYVNRVSEQV